MTTTKPLIRSDTFVVAVALTATTAVALTVWCARHAPSTWPALALFAGAGVVLSGIDIQTRLLPRKIVYPVLGVTFILIALSALISSRWVGIVTGLVGAALTAGFFYLVALATGGIGLGDIRLGLLTGLVAGWIGPAVIAQALVATAVLGACGGLVVWIRKRQMSIPYGPAMIAGTLVTIWASLYQV